MRRVHWARAATSDLAQIRTYLSEAYAPAYAQFVVERVVRSATWLLDHPHAGALLEHPRWRKWKPRRTRYVLIYEAVNDGIDVVRVRHDRNDRRPVPE